MLSKALLCLPAAAFVLFAAAPASAQDAAAAPSGIPTLCRASAAMEAPGCDPGSVSPGFARLGGQLAHAIMFYGGSGVQLVEPAPNASTASARAGTAPRPQPARLDRPAERPAFTLPLLTY